ncbi:MAG: universal stress protein [Planctomycetaceae bacterium]|nr:universal stress protein [Planctomycetaceae bacterium]
MRSRYGISVRDLLHPTDFSHGSHVAFAHALRLALDAQGSLEILHVNRERTRADWKSYPSVRGTLQKWGLLGANADRSEVARLGVSISKSSCHEHDPAAGILEHLERRHADIVVMATHQREGFDRWLKGSLAEKIANQTDAAALFVPYGVSGFVDLETGAVSLPSVLIPIDSNPSPNLIVQTVAALVDQLSCGETEVRLLHIGDPASTPAVDLPNSDKCRWVWQNRSGDVVDCICEDAAENDVRLIAMATNGHDGFLDALRGSTTERVLSRTRCPLLSVHEQ